MKRFLLLALPVCLALAAVAVADDTQAKKKNPVVVMKTSMDDIEIELIPDAAPLTVETSVGLAEGTKEWKDRAGTKQTKPFFDDLPFHRVIDGFMVQGGCPLGNGMGDPGFKFKDEINATALGLDKEMLFPNPNSANPQPHPYIMGVIDQRNPQRGQQQFQQTIILPLLKKLDIPLSEANARAKEWQPKLMKLTLKEVYENQGYKFDESLTAYHPKRGVIAMANSGPNTNGSQFFINVVDTPHLTGKHTVFGRVVKGMDIVDKISKVKVGAGSKPAEPVKIISIRRKK